MSLIRNAALIAVHLAIAAWTPPTIAQDNKEEATNEKEVYLSAAIDSLSRLIPLLELEEANGGNASPRLSAQRIAAQNSMDSIVFIYWLNTHSDRGNSRSSDYVDALSRAFYSTRGMEAMESIGNPLLLDDDFFKMEASERKEFLATRYGGQPFPFEITLDNRIYHRYTRQFLEWLTEDRRDSVNANRP